MAQAKEADKVLINFIGKLADGSIIDSTYPAHEGEACSDDACCGEHGPMELVIGEGDMYLPLEAALVGMQVGEKKRVEIGSDEAFGAYDAENVFSVSSSELPVEITPEVGMPLEVVGDDDEAYMVTIIEVTDSEVRLDLNHPLAGKDLQYEVELVEIL